MEQILQQRQGAAKPAGMGFVGTDTDGAGVPVRVRASGPRAFSLVELLIVIAIIAILASLVFPITKAVNRSKLRARAKAELAQIETAIETYKARIGVFPPDNPGYPGTNQLYYELVGTVLTNVGGVTVYRTLDGGSELNAASFTTFFGPGVGGLVNTAKPTGDDERKGGVNCLPGLNVAQIAVNPAGARVLVSSIKWPFGVNPPVYNPWRYNSSSPTNNPNSFDLWVDIIVDGKTNRISNWSKEPLIVAY